ncbi:MAG: aminopeptidase [Clostridia bacterium]
MELREKLFLKEKKLSDINVDTREKINEYAKGYMKFLDAAKTEREFVEKAIPLAIENGFEEFSYQKNYKSGEKFYLNNRGKSLILGVIGKEPLNSGVHIAASHIDSPRVDLKPHPLYEKDEMAFFKTHYYGGIKKYQWTCIPLALHGIMILENGEKITVTIGEEDTDPVFVITDLLPHLAKKQMDKKLNDAIEGENLNILIGNLPFKDDKESESVKLNILNILYEKYGIIEKDFFRAELLLVPAFKARDIGFDRSLIGAYGHDDRVCSYPILSSILEINDPKTTVITILADKEEVGSMGNTGMQSDVFVNMLRTLCENASVSFGQCTANSKCLSADVNAAYDPTYPEVMDNLNCAFVAKGTVLTKYTGGRGKGDTSDASAETMAYFIDLFDKNEIWWQSGELGKVDEGGGGTVAQYIANLNIDVVDLGVAVLSMHSPFEVVAKSDLYMTYRAVSEFFKA